MTSISFFAPTFKSRVSFDSLGSPSTEASKKRKRDLGSSENVSEILKNEADFPQSSARHWHQTLDDDIRTQHDLSRQVLEGLQGSNLTRGFPHRSQTPSLSKAKDEVASELASLKPPLYAFNRPSDDIGAAPSVTPGLRQRHLTALTTTLQKCLLEGDYIRAGRAWGLLLRTEHNGHTMDLRTNGRWGIGAEILLRRESELAQKRKDAGLLDSGDFGELDQERSHWFSVEGFQKASHYYERLVLQYPYRKVAPNATGPLDFYPALFGLWIYAVNEQHSAELGNIEKPTDRTRHRASRVDNESGSESETSVSDIELEIFQERENIRKRTLQRVQEIVARLDELLVSPPYSNSDGLRELHEMIGLWIKDLSLVDQPSMISTRNGSEYRDVERRTIAGASTV